MPGDLPTPTHSASLSRHVLWLEVGPMLVFFAAFQALRPHDPDRALFMAAGVFAVAAVLALLFGRWRHGRLSGPLLATTVVIVGTAGLASVFDSKLFLFMRPTVLNGGAGLLALGAALLAPRRLSRAIERRFGLPGALWRRLALRAGVFLIGLALINEWVWRTQGEAVWIAVKTFGFAPATLLFAVAHLPLIRRDVRVRTKG
ncbi:MAG: septation protein IspZ [Litorimonas sp.]